MALAIVMILAYIPVFYWAFKEVNEQSKPKKRAYEKIKTDDSWLW